MKIIFVLHGRLRKMDSLKKSIRTHFEKEFNVGFLTTTKISGARDPVMKAIDQGADYVIIAGGDGSINEGINGYMMASETKRRGVILGVLPMGTGNDFAHFIQVTKDFKDLLSLIRTHAVSKIDVCRMSFVGIKGKKISRYFINMADIGLGGQVAENLGNRMTLFGASAYYLVAIISSLFHFQKPNITLTSPEYSYSGKIISVCMANGKFIGSGLCLAPHARMDDGMIQLTIIGEISIFDLLRNLPNLRRCLKVRHKNVHYKTVSKVSITSENTQCPIEMDGEFVGYAPLDVVILPGEVQMLAKI